MLVRVARNQQPARRDMAVLYSEARRSGANAAGRRIVLSSMSTIGRGSVQSNLNPAIVPVGIVYYYLLSRLSGELRDRLLSQPEVSSSRVADCGLQLFYRYSEYLVNSTVRIDR